MPNVTQKNLGRVHIQCQRATLSFLHSNRRSEHSFISWLQVSRPWTQALKLSYHDFQLLSGYLRTTVIPLY